ncbi:hypothetical protein Csa_018502 [Cucumis sativus]|uniref:Uncharacterized protein n=1 Tax=Cucumis sativus TaxID=3659 RepID=A0A0A0KPH2_CUCSA|nr:hypothetical protein Csa_018502 [Cucumis sativus]
MGIVHLHLNNRTQIYNEGKFWAAITFQKYELCKIGKLARRPKKASRRYDCRSVMLRLDKMQWCLLLCTNYELSGKSAKQTLT